MQGMQGMQGMMLTPGADPGTSWGLILNREAVMQPHGREPPRVDLKGEFRNTAADGLPRVNDPERLDRWSIDVRFANLAAELFRPLLFSADEPGKGVVVSHVEMNWSNPGSAYPQVSKIFSMSRPPQEVFAAQLKQVSDWTELRAERMPEIMSQMAVPLQYWSAVADLNPTTFRYTLEFLNLALALAAYLVQPAKHYLACPRPVAYSPGIQPIINAGRFAVFPSGHATEAFLVARLLQMLSAHAKTVDVDQPDGSSVVKEHPFEAQLQRLAARIANNRVVAGVHFPIDAPAGRMVGETLAEYLVCRCGATTQWVPRGFQGSVLRKASADVVRGFSRSEPMDQIQAAGKPVPEYFEDNTGTVSAPTRTDSLVPGASHGLLTHLWKQAREEWA